MYDLDHKNEITQNSRLVWKQDFHQCNENKSSSNLWIINDSRENKNRLPKAMKHVNYLGMMSISKVSLVLLK